jgi:leucine dehydrogenase
MEMVRLETRHVAGLLGHSGDPSPYTARGVFRAIQASTNYLWNTDDVSGVSVALQGCGHVGYHLAQMLHARGAKLIVADVNEKSVARVADEFDAEIVKPAGIFGVRADVFAPCALGGVVNDHTIPELKVQIVAGAANNQLLDDKHGEMLRERNILYVPDYVANAGGVFNGCTEVLDWDSERASKKVDEIYDTVLGVFERAKAQEITTNKAADLIAEDRLNSGHSQGTH